MHADRAFPNGELEVKSITTLSAALTLSFLAAFAQGQTTWYVDDDAPGGTGTSWADAFIDLHDALGLAQPGDQIWIAAGVYTPDSTGTDDTLTFFVPNGVALYGGFAGNELLLDQRDPSVNITSLSGDIDGDDDDGFGSNGNINGPNSDHVVTIDGADSSTRLDGLEIIRAHGFPNASLSRGGGLNIVNGSPTIVNCRFWRNFSQQAGAVNIGNGAPSFEGCLFEFNIGSSFQGYGGGIYVSGTSSAIVEDCTFNGNKGEGILTHAYGGAIYTEAGAQLTVNRCQFIGNIALNRGNGGSGVSRGGAIFCQGDTVISNSTFDRNISTNAGAIQSWNTTGATRIHNSTFRNNDGISSFVGSQDYGGSAGAIAGGDELEIIGCVVYGGDADNYGGAWVGANAKVANSIFWGNTDSNGSIGRSNIRSSGDIEYCCVQNMLLGEPGEDPPDPEKFPGSISNDPMFVDPAQGDFRLQAGSPCIDAADNSAWPVTVISDLDANPRFHDDPATFDTGIGPAPVSDMGAYEFGSTLSTCPPDLNNDGALDFFDISAFLTAFTSMDPVADFTNDGTFDFFDISAFLNAFAAGCP